jgi:hypothetical protein
MYVTLYDVCVASCSVLDQSLIRLFFFYSLTHNTHTFLMLLASILLFIFKSLNQVEKKLSALAAKRGTQVDKLVETVHANGQLLEKIQQTLEASVMNQLISSIVMSDHDRDFCLSVNEVQELTVTLSCLPGVNFDQVAFNAFVNADDGKLTLDEVLKIIHQLKDDTVQGTDKVFTFHPKDVLKQ